MNAAHVTATDKQDHRGRIYQDPEAGKLVYRNSSLFTCIHSLIRERAGYGGKERTEDTEELDPEKGDSREEGRIHETWMREVYLPRNGWRVIWVEKEMNLAIGDHILLRMHLDGGLVRTHVPMPTRRCFVCSGSGIVAGAGEYTHESCFECLGAGFLEDPDQLTPERLCELKTGNVVWSDKFLTEGLAGFPGYLGQQAGPMIATGLPMSLYWKNRNNGSVYPPVLLERPPYQFGQIVLRIMTIEHHAAKIIEARNAGAEEHELNLLFPKCEEAYKRSWGYFCPHEEFHEDPEPEKEIPEMEPLAREYGNINNLSKTVKANLDRKNYLKLQLEEAIGEGRLVSAGAWEFGFHFGSEQLDMNKLKEGDPELYQALREKFSTKKRGNFFCRLRDKDARKKFKEQA